MYKYNDYELIYLIQSSQCEASLEIMMRKYRGLIYKYLHMYQIKEYDFEDAIQEANILMFDIISRFNEARGKTFTRFYELVLKRRLQYLKRKEPKYILVDEFVGFKSYDYPKVEEDIFIEELSDTEKLVYESYFVLNQKVSLISKKCGLNSKQIYNAIFRIKEKFKSML